MQPTARLINRQLGPVLALSTLLTEHHAPTIPWTIREDGILYGHISSANSRGLLRWFAEVLDTQPDEPFPFGFESRRRVSQAIHATWQDVQVVILTTSDASAYPELTERPAVAA